MWLGQELSKPLLPVRSGMGGVEGLDDPHPAAAARTWRRLDGCLGLIGAADAFGFLSSALRLRAVLGTAPASRAMAVGEQPVMADAVEAIRQDVQQETADELAGGELHHLVLASACLAIILPAEADCSSVSSRSRLLPMATRWV